MKEKGAFFDHLIALAELQQAKSGSAGYEEALNELEYHSRRTVELYLAMLQTEASRRIDMEQTHGEKQAQTSSELFMALEEIQVLKAGLKDQTEEIKGLREEVSAKSSSIKQLDALRTKDEELAAEHKKRIADLADLVADQKQAADRSVELEVTSLRLTKEAEELAEKLSDAQYALAEANEHHAMELKNSNSDHADRIERLQEKLELQRERELLVLRGEVQSQQAKESSDHNEIVRKLV